MKIKEFVKNNKLSICLVILLISMITFMMLFVQRDTDYFWHVTAGEYMLKHGLLTTDVFSWSVTGKYWMSHEWLFEIIINGFRSIFGNMHIFVYSFICTLSLAFILFFSRKKEYLKNTLFAFIWIACSLILSYFIQGRPQLLSYILLALTIWFCYDLYENKDSKKIYFLPLISIIWANVHGGSSNLGYLLCFLFFIVGFIQIDIGKLKSNKLSKKQLRKYLIIGIISLICISINLHGIKMIFYPYENMANTVMINSISEWRPTSLSDIEHYPYLLLLIIIMFVFLLSKKKIKLIDLVLFGVCVFLGMKSIRFWPFTYIIMNYVVFNYIDNRKPDKGTCMMLLIIGVFVIGLFISSSNRMIKNLNKHSLSNEMISIIKKENPERLFNMYDYGGELIYNDIKVFIDGRADLYSKYNYKDYLNISTLHGDFVKLFNKYDFDYCLVDKKFSINTYLKYRDDYEVIYKDKNILLYKKRA